MDAVVANETILDRMVRAVEKVRERVRRAANALESGGIDYAVIGGNAVAAWVAEVDPAAVRNTQDVDILIRRSDLESAKRAMASSGFVFRHVKSIDMFLDGPKSNARDAVRLVFAKEKVRPDDLAPSPDVTEAVSKDEFRVIGLDALVRMKLTSYRLKDRVHLLDLLHLGLIDRAWLRKIPHELRDRLREIIDNPES